MGSLPTIHRANALPATSIGTGNLKTMRQIYLESGINLRATKPLFANGINCSLPFAS